MPLPPSLLLALAQAGTAASDWITTGIDCSLFACGDLDGDGFDDLLTINGARQLCVSFGVQGWKASPWKVILEPAPEGAGALRLRRGVEVDTPSGTRRFRFDGERLQASDEEAEGATGLAAPVLEVLPPPYDLAARLLSTFHGDLDGNGRPDTLALFESHRPHAHRVVRVSLASDPDSGDMDSDGLSDSDEARLGTDPRDRDTDGDGLLDGWEVHGLPRGVEGPETALDPLRQDVIVLVSPYEPLTDVQVREQLERARRPYAEMRTQNPVGTSGIRLHYRLLAPVKKEEQGSWHWADAGNRVIPDEARGLVHWMQMTPGGGGQAQQNGDMGGSGLHWAAFAHELGHQLGLSHTGDSTPAWCPLYTSLMNYAFNYSFDGDGGKVRFSDGRFAAHELREEALAERLPYPIAETAYLARPPFHFTVEDDGNGGSWVDWNHDGRRDEGPVRADVNYGGSTYCGIRRDVERVGAAPVLVRVGDTIHLVTLDTTMSEVSIRAYQGDERWSEPREVPGSASEHDPVAVGTAEAGWVYLRRPQGWIACRFDADSIGEWTAIPAGILPPIEVSAGTVGGRVLLAGRRSDGTLATAWQEVAADGKPSWGAGPALDFVSDVVVGITQEPAGGRMVLVGAGPNAKGSPLCMKVAWLEPQDDGTWRKVEQRIVGGDQDVVHCTTRPTVRFTPEGRLVVFHTGWPDGNGEMTAWRTTMLSTRTLRDGWLVCLLYDVWTRTRRAVSFEIGPQGAVYAYRWDAAGEKQKLQVAHEGLGIDREPMRDFDDGALVSKWGIRHSILTMRR